MILAVGDGNAEFQFCAPTLVATKDQQPDIMPLFAFLISCSVIESSASILKNMRNAKRGGGDPPRNFCKNSTAFKNEGISGDLLRDSKQDVWTGLSDGLKSYMSKSVASIALFNGDKILFSCSGIAMEHQFCTKFLTTATLVRALNATNKYHNDLKIQVRLDGTKLYDGYIGEYDLDNDFAVVNAYHVRDVQVGPFQSALENLPHGVVFAVGRDTSGEIMVETVELSGDSMVL
ncbi:hypothetical protein EJB05_15702, partial [Eragrostis curvula]